MQLGKKDGDGIVRRETWRAGARRRVPRPCPNALNQDLRSPASRWRCIFSGIISSTTAQSLGVLFMAITVEATYENGVLKPVKPLPLQEHEKVEITIKPSSSWVQETYGILVW